MLIKTPASIIQPDLRIADGDGNKNLFDQIFRVFKAAFRGVYDDIINLSVGRSDALPTAKVDFVGKFYLITHAGARDTLHVCLYDGSISDYIWRQVTTT